MKECKYCAAELEENSKFCSQCGKPCEEAESEAQEMIVEETIPEGQETEVETAAQLPEADEEKSAEIKEGMKATPGRIAMVVAAIVLVIALVVALVGGMAPSGTAGVTTPTTEAAEEAAEPTDLLAVEATVPADGNPDDVTCKGSYTAEDEVVLAKADTVVATMGDVELTVSQLQVYYWLEVNNFLNMLYNYGLDATYYGMDYTLGLDQQACLIADGMTWQQFFLESALGSWQNYQSLALEGKENGFQLAEAQLTELDTLKETLDITAMGYGLADAEELLAMNVGNCATLDDYKIFLENNYMGGGYLNELVTNMEITDEDMEAYFTENEEAYSSNGLTRDLCSVDVRHILVFPEGADSSTIRTEEFSEEAWAAGEQKAQEILELYLAGDMTEDSFAALANEHSGDGGSNTNGGLYTDVMQGDMVEAFDAWCFDAARQTGDVEIVKTEFGYHVMYFVASEVLWPTYVRQDMQAEYQQELINAAVEKYPMEVDYSAIVLSYLDLMG